MSEWQTIERPGYLGKHRNEKFEEWNKEYGQDNWRLVWRAGESLVDFLGVCALYEDAYFEFLKKKRDVLAMLLSEASNVYDDEVSNINSGFDYQKQETPRTHIQDIAIRRSLIRMGLWFRGNKLVRIRQEKGDHALSMILSPGRVPFHLPDLIVQPEIEGWWDKESIESFYQSNRILQAKIK